MILETSALIALITSEQDAEVFFEAVAAASVLRMSAATYLESGIVLDRDPDPIVGRRLDELIAELAIAIEPVSPVQARLARDAYRFFGKHSGHPARLNFGDCFSYALAKDKREPLLFKGDDFLHTDVTPAL
ncbi:MAG: type II toxin-antitoxin system VapC family toxin [Alphaproteobacteria bacterium]|nr:type II toxin-antitoxin system VapC family toxin [Alphaproteobacteria bacterium]